jgi:hypothetical protein
MSDERFEIVQFKKTSKGKVYATKLGWATKRDDGGFWVNFDALPFGDGSCAVVPQRDRPAAAASTGSAPLADDEIPF